MIPAKSSNCGSLDPTTNSYATCFIDQREVLWLDYLDKETLALGLNEMNTEAYFSGTADYRVKAVFSNKSGEIDNEKSWSTG